MDKCPMCGRPSNTNHPTKCSDIWCLQHQLAAANARAEVAERAIQLFVSPTVRVSQAQRELTVNPTPLVTILAICYALAEEEKGESDEG